MTLGASFPLGRPFAAACLNVSPFARHRTHPARRHSAKFRISKASGLNALRRIDQVAVFTFPSRRGTPFLK